MSLWSWVKSRPSAAGVYGKKVVGADQLKSGAVLIQDLAKSWAPPSEDSVRRETFANACQRLGVDEVALRKTYKFYTTRFLIFLFFGVLSLVLMVGAMMSSVWTALPLIGFTALCLAQMYVSSFRCAQIRHHELFPVRVWIKNPQEWWIHPLIDHVSASHSSQSNRPGLDQPRSGQSSMTRSRPKVVSGGRDDQGHPFHSSDRRP